MLNWLYKSKSSKIPQDHARVGFIAVDIAEALAKLKTSIELLKSKAGDETFEHPSGVYFRNSGVDPKGKVVALFPGQGSQYVEMGIGSRDRFS